MTSMRTAVLTPLAMLAFAANSLLCRQALLRTGMDATSFTLVRLLSGALVLWLVVRLRRAPPGLMPRAGGDWWSAFMLFAYAAAFSFAYLSLPAAVGALLLFGAVQATMIGAGLWRGERFLGRQWAGLVLALCGLVGLLLPGLSAPPLGGAVLMLGAGVAWGVYSLRGKGVADPVGVTAGNFLRAAAMAAVLGATLSARVSVDMAGLGYAVASGALTSGIGYVLWYAALPGLRAGTAATVQLSVPVIATFGAVAFLGELWSPRLVLASVTILGGIALVVVPAGRKQF